MIASYVVDTTSGFGIFFGESVVQRLINAKANLDLQNTVVYVYVCARVYVYVCLCVYACVHVDRAACHALTM